MKGGDVVSQFALLDACDKLLLEEKQVALGGDHIEFFEGKPVGGDTGDALNKALQQEVTSGNVKTASLEEGGLL
jgi:hypothetical protein